MLSKQFIQVFAIVALMAISITGFAHNKVVVIPLAGDDVAIVPTSKIIFVTRSTFTGDLGGISGADDKCQAEAEDATPSVPGIFKAYIGDQHKSASDGRGFVKHDLPYNNINGDNVANNFEDFSDGEFNDDIHVIGSNMSGGDVWTGGLTSGLGTGAHCDNWSDAGPGGDPDRPSTGLAGYPRGGVEFDVEWIAGVELVCESRAGLYCFEQ